MIAVLIRKGNLEQRRAQRKDCVKTGKRQPSASQGERPQEKSTLPTSDLKFLVSRTGKKFISLVFSAICKAFSDNHFCLLEFLFLGDGFGHHLLYNDINLHP